MAFGPSSRSKKGGLYQKPSSNTKRKREDHEADANMYTECFEPSYVVLFCLHVTIMSVMF